MIYIKPGLLGSQKSATEQNQCYEPGQYLSNEHYERGEPYQARSLGKPSRCNRTKSVSPERYLVNRHHEKVDASSLLGGGTASSTEQNKHHRREFIIKLGHMLDVLGSHNSVAEPNKHHERVHTYQLNTMRGVVPATTSPLTTTNSVVVVVAFCSCF